MRYKSQMLHFNFPDFFLKTQKSLTQVADMIGISSNSFRKMVNRKTIKHEILSKLTFHFGEKTTKHFIIKRGRNENS